MKEHVPTLALIAALAMVLAALLIVALRASADASLVISLAGTAGTIAGGICGFSQQNRKPAANANAETPRKEE